MFAGVSGSVAVTLNDSVDSICMAWSDIAFSTGGEVASRTVTVNACESELVPSDTVTLSVWTPIWDAAGVQANAPVELFIVAPLGGLTRL